MMTMMVATFPTLWQWFYGRFEKGLEGLKALSVLIAPALQKQKHGEGEGEGEGDNETMRERESENKSNLENWTENVRG